MVWVHVGCAYWSPGVCLVGDELKGLEDAIVAGGTTVSSGEGVWSLKKWVWLVVWLIK